MSALSTGQVTHLTRQLDDMRPGFYIYVGECSLMARFCLAGEDDEGDVCTTDTRFDVHIDFLELFGTTGIAVDLEH